MEESILMSVDNPVIKNHTVYGKPLLPGLAYIDILYQFFRERGYDYTMLELRNLSIYSPLIVEQDREVLLTIRCSESGKDKWRIAVEGRLKPGEGYAPDKISYISAEMVLTGGTKFDESVDIDGFKKTAGEIVNMDRVYEQCRKKELVHSRFIKAAGNLYDTDNEVFVDILIDQSAAASSEGFMFHPALVDGSTIAAGACIGLSSGEEEGLYLPLYYESFRASELFNKKCIARVKKDSIRKVNELIILTIEFFNEYGEKIGELKNAASKSVREKGWINEINKSAAGENREYRNKGYSRDTGVGNKPESGSKAVYKKYENLLKTLMAERLNVSEEQIDPEAGYYEMGLDSAGLLETVKYLGQVVEEELPPTLLFEYTTISELAVYLTEHYGHKFTENEAVLSVDENKPVNGTGTIDCPGKKSDSYGTWNEDDIAIIGMAGRYPGAENIDEFWENLLEGKDCITEIPKERWDWRKTENIKSPSGKSISRWGGFLENYDCFDPQFFRISPREAEIMDPQERLFLETCWEAIEDSGYTPKTLVKPKGQNHRMNVGVYAGVMHKDYVSVGTDLISENNILPLPLNDAPIANRVSYFCNFHGPSITMDTACSSSLTAVYLAVQGIKSGECEVALAGGVNLSLHPNKYITYGIMDMHSSEGYCKAFGKGGDGYVSGEGCGAVLLKPLKKAVHDGDNIYAVIKGCAVNHVGTVSGITVPSPVAQADMIAACLEKAGVHPRTVSYVEAHGTGTSLGDPIEIQGLVKAYQQYTKDVKFCSIGSVKSNIGHAEAAAGVSGLHKAALQIYHKTLVPSLHAEELNPYIDFDKSPFYVQKRAEAWRQPVFTEGSETVYCPRRAAVSSFGATGSNVHIIMEEYNPEEEVNEAEINERVIIPLSAKNKERLLEYAGKLLEFLRKSLCKNGLQSTDTDRILDLDSIKGHTGDFARGKINILNLSYTLQAGRIPLEERVAFVVRDVPELVHGLEEYLNGEKDIRNCYRGQVRQNADTIALFTEDEDSRELVQKWLDKGKTEKLAELWVKGMELDWNLLNSKRKPFRMSLPTYPFARTRYWMNVPEKAMPAAITKGAASGNTQNKMENRDESSYTYDTLDELIYLPVWEECSQPVLSKVNTPASVLIVYSNLSEDLKDTIQDYYRNIPDGASIISVKLCGENRKNSPTEWMCDVLDPDGFENVIRQCEVFDCFYFISRCEKSTNIDTDLLVESPHNNEMQLLRCIKALKKWNGSEHPIDCFILTQDNYRVTGEDINPYGGGIAGLAYAIAQGDYRFRVRNMDISKEDLETEESRRGFMELISKEQASDRGELIKISKGSRYRQVFYTLDTGRYMHKSGLKNGGVYVVLGGSGTVGQAITGYLMKEYNARVVWIGRKPENSDLIKKKLEALRGMGDLPLYIQADILNLEQMKQAVEAVKKHYGRINGAIFSGLVINFENSVDKTTEKDFLDILNVKTTGSINFYSAFKDEALDFMCYFSSGQAFSFSGAATLSAYASGITFSDTFARYIGSRSKFPVGIINWGFWKSSLEGIAVSNDIMALEDKQGFELFKLYTYLLTEEALPQAVCMKTSDTVSALMNKNSGQKIKIYEGRTKGPFLRKWYPGSGYCRMEGLTNGGMLQEYGSLAAQLLFIQLRKLGVFHYDYKPGETLKLIKKVGIIPKYERWLDEGIRILEESGFIGLKAGKVAVLKNIDEESEGEIWDAWNSAGDRGMKESPWGAQLALTDACLKSLPDILRGTTSATDVIFPNSSMEMVEGIYKNNALSDFFNRAAADIAENYVKQQLDLNPGKKVRIIEAGAGTGGTSAMILSKLKQYAGSVEYCYTDISRSFLMFAEKQYGPQYPFLTYKLWNIEIPPENQETEPGKFDIVVAANVLHATKNIRNTLRNIKAVMKTNGVLLLYEGTQKSVFTTLTFGLLDGWWLFEDEHLRIPGSPILSSEKWNKVLNEEGFNNVYFPMEQWHHMGFQIISASSDGLVRREMEYGVAKNVEKAGAGDAGTDRRKENDSPEDYKHTYETAPLINTANGVKQTGINAEEYIRDVIVFRLSEALKVPREQVDNSMAFSDYGVDSIIGVAFVKQVNEELGLNMNTAILFDYTTVDRLTEYIVKNYGEQIRRSLTTRKDGEHLQDVHRGTDRLYESEPETGVEEKIANGSIEDDMILKMQKLFFSDDIDAEMLLKTVSDMKRGKNNG